MATPETQYARAPDGVQLAYQVSGSGEAVVVLMLGTVAHLELAWDDPQLRRLFDRLGSFARLVRFDRRGMGMSDPLDAVPTLAEQIDDFGTVLDAVDVSRATLMGTGDAGLIALAFAAARPERVESVVAFETTPRQLPSPDDDFGADIPTLQRMAAASLEIDLETHLSIVAPARMNEPGFRSWFRRFVRSASSGFRIDAFIREVVTWDIVDRLPSIAVPVLVLNRTWNTILPLRNARALAAALPAGRLAEIPGSGTVIFADDVEDIADEIEAFVTGVRPLPRRDRVLATVLFTDVVGSTDRAAALGDRAWGGLLERHNTILRDAIARFGGREVSTAGDGFLATFDSPRRAIESARSAGESVSDIGLEIRAGVHAGEIELVGDDIQGLAVHIGARIASLAGAREILVSSTVRDLVAGSGITFVDRGEHALKGVPDPWRIYQVV
jgi:class 3 adenylate cyclase